MIIRLNNKDIKEVLRCPVCLQELKEKTPFPDYEEQYTFYCCSIECARICHITNSLDSISDNLELLKDDVTEIVNCLNSRLRL